MYTHPFFFQLTIFHISLSENAMYETWLFFNGETWGETTDYWGVFHGFPRNFGQAHVGTVTENLYPKPDFTKPKPFCSRNSHQKFLVFWAMKLASKIGGVLGFPYQKTPQILGMGQN